MTAEELQKLEDLANAATPGPWNVHKCGWEKVGDACGIRQEPVTSSYEIRQLDGTVVRGETTNGLHVVYDTNRDECCHGMHSENAEFIAAAREAVPALVADVRRLRVVVERMAMIAHGEHEGRRDPDDWRACTNPACASARQTLGMERLKPIRIEDL
jgi:hypothetical protein